MLSAYLVAFLSVIVPGFFLALALLRKTKLHMFEIVVIGFIFGLVFPPTITWLESFLMQYIHAFAFSAGLYNANVVVLSIIGIGLSYWQGAFDFLKKKDRKQENAELAKDYKSRIGELRETLKLYNIDTSLIKKHEEEVALAKKQAQELSLLKAMPEEQHRVEALHKEEEKKLIEEHEKEEKILIDSTKEEKGWSSMKIVWGVLIVFMLLAFITRIAGIGTSSTFFEFDPYFDMMETEQILVHGGQLLFSHAAWPTALNGTVVRIQPLLPYLEAYWYQLANGNNTSTYSIGGNSPNTTLLSLVSGIYPPITAALLVFVVFLFLYHEYGKFPALVGAGLATAMPALITTFIAGEQLLEPWGIFAMFFFYAAYLLAVNEPKEKRYAILAGIAYSSTFLGAHYFTVTAGVLAIYIILQGLIHVIRNEKMHDFYVMNIIMLIVISLFFVPYHEYHATLSGRIPNLLGIPITVAFPLYSLVFVFIIEFLANAFAEKLLRYKSLVYLLTAISGVGIVALAASYLTKNLERHAKAYSRYAIVSVLAIIALLIILLTPIGRPVDSYLQLSKHFTTPSIPLFMTVQEYAPTGINYNFGSAGFGIIGASIGGVNIIVWIVMVLFVGLAGLAIYYRNSKSSILSMAAILPLAAAGMIEVKYLPHFGVGYILAIGIIIGELILLAKNGFSLKAIAAGVALGGAAGGMVAEKIKGAAHSVDYRFIKALYAAAIIVVILEFATFANIIAAAGQSCNAIANQGNAIGYDIFCNLVPNYWLNATTWMRSNVGVYGPRILSWWDYGDWINWFGNSNAVLRGDNAVATLDYATAAQYVLGPADGYNASTIGRFMDSIQSKYLLLDNQLQQKWQALDFLACVHVNQTDMAFAEQQGKLVGQPYVLGQSQCELTHDPAYAFIPASPNSVSNYCQFGGNSSITAVKAIMLAGNTFLNQTYCVPTSLYTSSAPVHLYTANGIMTNALIVPNQQFYYGVQNVGGTQFVDFMVLYAPNGPNDTITDAPTEFYNSTYYKAFFFGKLPGFSLAYPGNFVGMNYVNSTNPIVILSLNNYTGGNAPVTPKPSWITNNYSIPG